MHQQRQEVQRQQGQHRGRRGPKKDRAARRHFGTIKRYGPNHFGFIHSPELDEDLFFHASAVPEEKRGPHHLHKGILVTFERKMTPKGPKAVRVEVLGY